MTEKELSRYYWLKKEVKNLEERLLELGIGLSAMNIENEISGSSSNTTFQQRRAELVEKIINARLSALEEYLKIESYIEKIEDPNLHTFVLEQITKHQDSFKQKPAGISMHHNFVGGLLVHTTECLEFAELNMKNFACEINKDNIYAATLLHDLGKIFEYNIDLETGAIE